MDSKEFEKLKGFFQSHVEHGLVASKDNIDKIINQNATIKKNIQILKAEYKLSRLINEELKTNNFPSEVDTISKELKEIKNSSHIVVGTTTINKFLEVDSSSIKVISMDIQPKELDFGYETEFQKTNELSKSA
ncbi:hypothetical protein [Ureibacillus chungkukjangi]|uniref:Uncharacterized protein n=1 Tax=Ureibacillus chungkukjangi TaxID=1202712 RepID=A0A318TLA9_9BACL|nr:hypothetical protein [Ureibacillus chungkukjangi]PYF05632.1 hypothetical protein BJ095_11741 [Ureibacillus chungkukjangi]